MVLAGESTYDLIYPPSNSHRIAYEIVALFPSNVQRASIPTDITSGSPDPDTWGTPAAAWPSTTCDMEEFFTEQNIIINITLCGLW